MVQSSKSSRADGDGQHHHHSCPIINIINPSPDSRVYVNNIINPPRWSGPSWVNAFQKIRVHADTVTLDPDDKNSGSQLLSFSFDALERGRFNISYVAKEEADKLSPLHSNNNEPMRSIQFQNGFSQKFVHLEGNRVNPISLFELQELSKHSSKGDACDFQLVISAETCLPSSSVSLPTSNHGQVTLAVLEKNKDDHHFQVKVIKQKSWWEETTYEPQIFSGTDKAIEPAGDEATETAVSPSKQKMSTLAWPVMVQHSNGHGEAASVTGFETKHIDNSALIKGENVVLNSSEGIYIGPGAGSDNKGDLSGSINDLTGNINIGTPAEASNASMMRSILYALI